jgi:putative hydrolase of the HAD superfamily
MPATPMIELVLFDVDGTLVDHEGAVDSAVREWLAGTGLARSAGGPTDELVEAWTAIAERHLPAYRSGVLTFPGQRRARLRDFLPLVGVDPAGWADDALDATFAGYLAAYEAAWLAYPDAAPCLAATAARARVAVLSNGDQAQQEAKLRRTGLAGLVPDVFTSGGLGVAKPDPAAFRAACDRLGVPPGRAAYVGDRADVDAVAATAAGLRGVWVNRLGEAAPSGVAVIGSLAELPARLGLAAPDGVIS